MMNGFVKDWEDSFENVLPDGSELREEWPSRWTRFHALPNSKTLAHNELETAEILRRANTFGNVLFTTGERIWVASCHWLASGDRPNPEVITPAGVSMALCKEWLLPEEYFEIPSVPVYAALVYWAEGTFDGLFQQAAEDRGNAVFFSPDTGRALAPYCGGFDLFADSATLLMLERDHRDWMSKREDKL